MSLLVRTIHLRISQAQIALTSKCSENSEWMNAQEIYETNMSIFHIPQKKCNRSFADKAVVLTDFIF